MSASSSSVSPTCLPNKTCLLFFHSSFPQSLFPFFPHYVPLCLSLSRSLSLSSPLSLSLSLSSSLSVSGLSVPSPSPSPLPPSLSALLSFPPTLSFLSFLGSLISLSFHLYLLHLHTHLFTISSPSPPLSASPPLYHHVGPYSQLTLSLSTHAHRQTHTRPHTYTYLSAYTQKHFSSLIISLYFHE